MTKGPQTDYNTCGSMKNVRKAQIVNYNKNESIYENTMSGFPQNHSYITLLLKLKDDIIKAMGRGEVTLVVLADFSKVSDTTD